MFLDFYFKIYNILRKNRINLFERKWFALYIIRKDRDIYRR